MEIEDKLVSDQTVDVHPSHNEEVLDIDETLMRELINLTEDGNLYARPAARNRKPIDIESLMSRLVPHGVLSECLPQGAAKLKSRPLTRELPVVTAQQAAKEELMGEYMAVD